MESGDGENTGQLESFEQLIYNFVLLEELVSVIT